MSYQLTPTTVVYRSAVALAAAQGSALSPIAFIAFTSDASPYQPDVDDTLPGEFKRLPAILSVAGPVVTARAVLTGVDAGGHVIRGAAVFTEDGTLVGRRALSPKELELETELEIEITFEY